jgi:palmitoyltransferase
MENSVLHREFGYVFNDHKKRKVKRRWKDEFGGVEVDQRWAVGSWMERWKMEMGSKPIGWFRKSYPTLLRTVLMSSTYRPT